jgi:tetratricopeptide (TPR) repeat protein
MDDTWGVGHATGALAGLAWSTGDAASARALFERALSIYRSLGDKRGIRSATSALGKMAYRAGDYASARALLEQSLFLARNQRDTFATEGALCALGELARLEGDYARAGALYTEALQLDREMLGTYRQPEVLCNLGYVALHERDYARARALFQESLTLNRQGGLAAGILPCVTGCAGLVGAAGQPQAAARLLGAVESSLRALGLVMDAPERMEYDRIVEAARAQLDEATFQAAWAKGQAMTLEQAVVYALEETGP